MLRLHFEADQAATQVAANMPLDRLGARSAVSRVRHQPEDVADELDDGGLAGAAPADDAVQPVAELESGAVQESALDLQAENAVMRRAVIGRVLACGEIRRGHLVHARLL